MYFLIYFYLNILIINIFCDTHCLRLRVVLFLFNTLEPSLYYMYLRYILYVGYYVQDYIFMF